MKTKIPCVICFEDMNEFKLGRTDACVPWGKFTDITMRYFYSEIYYSLDTFLRKYDFGAWYV